jgi:DNA-binding MarR family transcriptional regulator
MAHPESIKPSGRTLESFLCFAIHATGFAFNRAYRRHLQRIGLTYPQYLVMVSLWENDIVTVGQLSEQLMLESNTMTPMLKRLEALGLIARRRSAADERKVLVSLTDKGRALESEAADITHCIALDAGLSQPEVARLIAQIEVLRANLDRASGVSVTQATQSGG